MNLFSLTLVAVLAATSASPADRPPTETALPTWVVRPGVDPTTVRPGLVLAMESSPGPGTLHLRCTDEGPEVLVSWNEYLGSNSTGVVVRSGDRKPTVQKWTATPGWSALIAPDPMGLLERLLATGGVTLEVLPFRGGSARVSIPAGDLVRHLPRLASCR